jgi:hypothetical protein
MYSYKIYFSSSNNQIKFVKKKIKKNMAARMQTLEDQEECLADNITIQTSANVRGKNKIYYFSQKFDTKAAALNAIHEMKIWAYKDDKKSKAGEFF